MYRGLFVDDRKHALVAVLDELCAALADADEFAYDLETTSFSPYTGKIMGISFAVWHKMVPSDCSNKCCAGELFPKSWYLPFVPERANHLSNEEARRKFPGQYYDIREVFDRIRPFMEDPQKAKVGQNLKFDGKFMTASGIRVRGQIIDTCVASSLCDENRSSHKLKDLVYDYLGHDMVRFDELGGLFSPPIDKYGADDSCQALRLWREVFKPQLEREGLMKVFLELECRIVRVLEAVELKGARIDVDYLDELDKYLIAEREKVEREAFELAGRSFQITSPEAVAHLLFTTLGWRKIGHVTTATGKISTAEGVLERYVDHPKYGPLARAILKHRKIGKLKSTYVDTLGLDARMIDGRVRSLFNQVHKPWENSGGAVTGRFSSSRDDDLGGTNFQNIPTRANAYLGDTGKKIRNAFVAEPGNKLVVLDLSQIELRFMAHYSQDKTLLNAYRNWDCVECGASGALRTVAHKCPKCGAPEGHRRREKGCALCDASDVPEDAPKHGFCLGLDLHSITAQICGVDRNMGKTVNFALLYGMIAKTLAARIECSVKLAEKIHYNYFKGYPGIRRYHQKSIAKVMRTGYITTVLKRRRRFPHKRGREIKPWEREWRQAVNHPIQGSAADLMKVGMRNIHERIEREALEDTGIILQVHDELAVETPEERASYVYDMMQYEMEHAFPIAVPVMAEGSIADSWGQAK